MVMDNTRQDKTRQLGKNRGILKLRLAFVETNILLLPALRIVPGLYSIYVLHISNFLSLAHIC